MSELLFDNAPVHPKMPQCQAHGLYYVEGGECFYCVVEHSEPEGARELIELRKSRGEG